MVDAVRYGPAVSLADVVVVSYNSAGTIGACVSPLVGDGTFTVVVIDNASQDGSVSAAADLSVQVLALDHNHGFAYGCNRGWRNGSSPFVLFLNPDARIDRESLLRLIQVLKDHEDVAAVGPRISAEDGSLELSQRRFPRLRSTYAQAFFLHRILPRARWVDEVVHDPAVYVKPQAVEWISGACVLVRREALERIGGWDDGFFMYGEDKDLCRRLWNAGYSVRYEPSASVVHLGGLSAPRAGLLPTLAASRIRYARKHRGPLVALLERVGVAVGALTHSVLTTQGANMRAGYMRAFLTSLFRGSSAAKRPGAASRSGPA
jgi:GT2 family glycosyltransferase